MAEDIAVRVDGLRELQRAFQLTGLGMEAGLREAMESASESVRVDAQALAVDRIRNIGVPWSRMRVGVTRRTAYVAPVERGRRTRPGRGRPNLANLLSGRAMEPALERNIANVERDFGEALDDLFRVWSRV